ncbi:hypothetical protein E5Q_01131, partial [Mixia osmundae IAM 14324]
KLKVKYEERCATLESELNKPSGEEKREKHTLALRKTARSHLSIASKAMATFHELCETRALITLRGLALQSAEADKSALDTVLAESQQAILEAQEAIEEVKARLNKCKMEASAVYQKASAKMDELPPEMSERVTERNAMGTPAEQLMIERETRQGELELLANVGSDVLRQYEERQEFIEVLRAKVVADDAALEKLRTSVQKVRHLYTPAIEALVRRVSERFGEAFNRFGCLGEINLNSESEDYDQWGIEISVSFRKQEALSLLTATRQSGGERSLSTILYLMSLTELAKAPFSLVDEINQGMDQRAERRVHNQLVAVTCTQDAGQYFLITPKLLPNLEYHQMMKILCVDSPDDQLQSSERTMSKEFSFEELSAKKSKDDLHLLIHGKVYSVAKFLDEHPGGDEVLLGEGGRDATEAFEDVGHSDEARKLLEDFVVGTCKEQRDRHHQRRPQSLRAVPCQHQRVSPTSFLWASSSLTLPGGSHWLSRYARQSVPHRSWCLSSLDCTRKPRVRLKLDQQSNAIIIRDLCTANE